VLAAVTPTGELAGFLWVLRDELTDGEVIARLRQIYVRPEYRGLGLARTMITEYLKEAHYEGVRTFLAAALGAGQVLADVFTQESGVLLEQTYEIDLRRWYLNSFLS
jgi:GNAT superfamily N-acetyltransferase